MGIAIHAGLVALSASLLLAGAVVFRGRRDLMAQPGRFQTALMILAAYAAAVTSFDALLAFTTSDPSVGTVHDVAEARWVLHSLIVTPGIAALAGARWPRASAWSLVGLAAAVPLAWIAFIAAYAEVSDEDVGDAGLLVVVLVPAVSGPFAGAGAVMKDSVRPTRASAASQSLPPPMGDRDASWHPDPSGRHELRWWNGRRWDDYVADAGEVIRDTLPPGCPEPTAPHGQAPNETR